LVLAFCRPPIPTGTRSLTRSNHGNRNFGDAAAPGSETEKNFAGFTAIPPIEELDARCVGEMFSTQTQWNSMLKAGDGHPMMDVRCSIAQIVFRCVARFSGIFGKPGSKKQNRWVRFRFMRSMSIFPHVSKKLPVKRRIVKSCHAIAHSI
jgi:hypothetical protein